MQLAEKQLMWAELTCVVRGVAQEADYFIVCGLLATVYLGTSLKSDDSLLIVAMYMGRDVLIGTVLRNIL